MHFYVLTKRSAPSDDGKMSHHIYGCTIHIQEARAWFKATRVTDVIELKTDADPRNLAHETWSSINDTRRESWREIQLREEKELAALNATKQT
jgi:hypothetical protein